MELELPTTLPTAPVVALTVLLAITQLTGLFVNYGQFKSVLKSSRLSERVEYVEMSHPDFEFICYLCDRCVVSVKFSDDQKEKYVLVPKSEWIQFLTAIETRKICIVAAN